jgi:hypothetical protein
MGAVVTNQALTMQSTCEAAYNAWTSGQKICRSYHLCNATGTGMATMHCPHAQGVGLCP